MILESILEKSGLTKDREYFVQTYLKDESSNYHENGNSKRTTINHKSSLLRNNMGLLTVLMWVIGLVFFGAFLLSFFGNVALETDKAKANRYLADLHDRESRT